MRTKCFYLSISSVDNGTGKDIYTDTYDCAQVITDDNVVIVLVILE